MSAPAGAGDGQAALVRALGVAVGADEVALRNLGPECRLGAERRAAIAASRFGSRDPHVEAWRSTYLK